MTDRPIHTRACGNARISRSGLKVFCVLTFIVLSFVPTSSTAQNSSPTFDELTSSADSARAAGDIPRAIGLYQKAVQINPQWPDGWWYLGSLQYVVNAYAPAIDALTHYIELTPGAGPAFALRGLCEFEEGQYPQALQDLQHGTALGAANQPRNAGIILYHEAILLTRLGRYEEALGEYSALVKQGNINDDITNGIGLAGLRMPVFPKDIDASQQPMVSMVGHAAAAVMSGDQNNGPQAFSDLFNRFPTTPYLHYLYGYLLFVTDPGEAIAQFQKELDISPSSAVAHSMLAWAQSMQGDFATALPNAQKSVAEDPTIPMAQLVLGKDLVETGDMNAGLPHLVAVLKTEPQNLEAHLALAKAYSKLGRKDDARRERLLCLSLSGQGTAANANL